MATPGYRDDQPDAGDRLHHEAPPVATREDDEQGSYQTQPGYGPAPYQGPQPGYGQPTYQAPQQYAPASGPQWSPQAQWPQGHGGGMDMAEFSRRYIRTPETKEFYRTSEFAAYVLAVAAVLVASAIDTGFDAFEAWILVTAATIGYMISRGLSKAGARRGDPERDTEGRRP